MSLFNARVVQSTFSSQRYSMYNYFTLKMADFVSYKGLILLSLSIDY